MLRSRDNTKNAQQQNGIEIDEPTQSSSFTKYGVLVCILFAVIVVYFVFIDDDSNTFNNNNNNNLLPSNRNSVINPSQPQSLNTPPSSGPFGGAPLSSPLSSKTNLLNLGSNNNGLSMTNKLSHSAFTAKALHPKILGDLNPMENDKLQRLINRQDRMDRSKKNKLNNLWSRGGLTHPLKALTGPHPAYPTDDGETKEISLRLDAESLPKMTGRRSSVFIRQSYPIRGDFNHDFVLIFLHGAAYSSATWSELGILSELAKQGYISYAIDIPGYGESVKTVTNNNKWLREIINKLIGRDERIIKYIKSAGGISTVGKKFVIITASMSGRFAVPLLIEDVPSNMIGMITIAPVSTDKFKKEQYEKVTIPVCIIYGEDDKNLGEQSKQNLIQIPNHKLIMIPNGSHAAYKSDPKLFHQQIVKWLNEFFD